MASPIGRQASEHLGKNLLLFHRVVGKKIFDRSNLSILVVMRWNLLFEELENGFEELLATQSPPTPHASNQISNPLSEMFLGAKSTKSAVLFIDVRGNETWLTPRAVGRDWASGRIESGEERIILLDSIVAANAVDDCGDVQEAPAPISISGLLQMWKNRGEPIGVEVRTGSFVGQLSEVSDQGISIRSTRAGTPTNWFIPFRHVVSVKGVSDHGSL